MFADSVGFPFPNIHSTRLVKNLLVYLLGTGATPKNSKKALILQYAHHP